jgi:predicted transcriptional regulator
MLSIRLDPKLYYRLKAVAKERKTSMNMLCRKCLDDALLVREVSLIIQTEKRR